MRCTCGTHINKYISLAYSAKQQGVWATTTRQNNNIICLTHRHFGVRLNGFYGTHLTSYFCGSRHNNDVKSPSLSRCELFFSLKPLVPRLIHIVGRERDGIIAEDLWLIKVIFWGEIFVDVDVVKQFAIDRAETSCFGGMSLPKTTISACGLSRSKGQLPVVILDVWNDGLPFSGRALLPGHLHQPFLFCGKPHYVNFVLLIRRKVIVTLKIREFWENRARPWSNVKLKSDCRVRWFLG